MMTTAQLMPQNTQSAPTSPLNKIIKRNGETADFDRSCIERAIEGACDAVSTDKSFIPSLTDFIIQDLEVFLRLFPNRVPSVEEVQDLVEQNLMKFNKYDVGRAFIIYRESQKHRREAEHEKDIRKLEKRTLQVVKRDGSMATFDIEKLKTVFDRVSRGYEEECTFEELYESFKNMVVDRISTDDILRGLRKSCIDLVSIENTNWQHIAGRITACLLYKQACRNRNITETDIYSVESFITHFDDYIANKHYYTDFRNYYSEADLRELAEAIDPQRDFTYGYSTMLSMEKRYLLNPNGIIKELPQEMYLAVAMFLAVPEDDSKRVSIAKDIYDVISTMKLSLPTPTLLNARTNYHQLSSCFKLNIDDDLRAIYHGFENMAQISKFGGGVGVYLGHIRSRGGFIRGVKGASGGTIPWVRLINDTAVAVNQLGSRMGAISPTLDIWHRDISDFLNIQTETGDIRSKAFDVFPAVSVPDLFMERALANEQWTLFDPHEVYGVFGKRLEDFFGEEFNAFYAECEASNDLMLKETLTAKELIKELMKTAVETGMPYIFFRDTVNDVNPNKHAGNIYSTQLCTEICQNTSPSTFKEEVDDDGTVTVSYQAGETVVCNLASINMANVFTPEDIKHVFPIAMRVLDNVISLNLFPIKESERTAKQYRSVGLGFMGLAEYLACNGYSYDTAEAREHVDQLFEQYAYETLLASTKLSKERGAYELFEGSEWSKGILFGRDENWYANNTQNPEEWAQLITDIKKDGLRFSYHLAPAPNTSTSGVVGTTAGLLPVYKKFFVETNAMAPTVTVAPKLSQKNFWLYKEYVHMDMEDVIDMIGTVYKWIDQSISFEWMINPAKTSPSQLFGYYVKAWQQKIKTIYYIRSLSGEITESCESCSG